MHPDLLEEVGVRGLRRLAIALVVMGTAALALMFIGRDAVQATSQLGVPAVAQAPAPAAVESEQQEPAVPLQVTAVPVAGMSDDMVLGNPDAPVTVIEYSSLTCPHCAAFHRTTLAQIKKEWLETGKAKLVYRDFPLDGIALGAAMLARCVPTERYFGFLDTLFQTQQQWAYSKNPLGALQNLAGLAGLPEDKFQACLSDQKMMADIKAKQKAGADEYKIESTPTFVIDGKTILGNQPYEVFAEALKAAQ